MSDSKSSPAPNLNPSDSNRRLVSEDRDGRPTSPTTVGPSTTTSTRPTGSTILQTGTDLDPSLLLASHAVTSWADHGQVEHVAAGSPGPSHVDKIVGTPRLPSTTIDGATLEDLLVDDPENLSFLDAAWEDPNPMSPKLSTPLRLECDVSSSLQAMETPQRQQIPTSILGSVACSTESAAELPAPEATHAVQGNGMPTPNLARSCVGGQEPLLGEDEPFDFAPWQRSTTQLYSECQGSRPPCEVVGRSIQEGSPGLTLPQAPREEIGQRSHVPLETCTFTAREITPNMSFVAATIHCRLLHLVQVQESFWATLRTEPGSEVYDTSSSKLGPDLWLLSGFMTSRSTEAVSQHFSQSHHDHRAMSRAQYSVAAPPSAGFKRKRVVDSKPSLYGRTSDDSSDAESEQSLAEASEANPRTWKPRDLKRLRGYVDEGRPWKWIFRQFPTRTEGAVRVRWSMIKSKAAT